MRVRTEARRDAIIEAASLLFRESGFERTSMATISAHVGGSKATLYGYFPSKESLFAAVIVRSAQQELEAVLEDLETGKASLRTRLERFGDEFLGFLSSPDMVASRRMVIAEAGKSEVGRILYDNGPAKIEARIVAVLQAAMKAGELRRADPRIAMLQLVALIEAESLLPNLLGLKESWTKQEIAQMARRAVATFVLAYAPAS